MKGRSIPYPHRFLEGLPLRRLRYGAIGILWAGLILLANPAKAQNVPVDSTNSQVDTLQIAGDTTNALRDTLQIAGDTTKAGKGKQKDGKVPEIKIAATEGDSIQDPDSLRAQKRARIKAKTDNIDLQALMDGRNARTEMRYYIEETQMPDILERLDGFSNSLGQWGKPYMRLFHGFDASYYDRGIFINPITGAENAYIIDPEKGMRYFDSRTPFVNINYAQGKADATQIRVDVSQNVHPLVNVALLYLHRQCKGVYNNFVTDHNTLGTAANFHTLNERYRVFAHFLFQHHNDNLNGGVSLSADSLLFDKDIQPVVLSSAILRNVSRAAVLRQFYRITKDTLQSKHDLTAYAGITIDYFLSQFTDRGILATVNDGYFPAYPTLGDSSYFWEKYDLNRFKVDGGLTWTFDTLKWHTRQRLEFAFESLDLKKNLQHTTQQRYTVLWKGDLRKERLANEIQATWQYRHTNSKLFTPESYFELDLAYRFPEAVLNYSRRVPGPPLNPQDSTTVTKTHRPFAIKMNFLSYNRNPTLQQAYGNGWYGNTLVANPDFNNRRFAHFSFGIEAKSKDRWTTTGTLNGKSIGISAFTSQNYGTIYFKGTEGWIQHRSDVYTTWSGIEGKLRVNVGHFYLENQTVLQSFFTNGRKVDSLFRYMQPTFYTKASLFYENKDLKFASILRVGFDFWYFSGFRAPYFDSASQQFYAQNTFDTYQYPRLDVFFATQLKRAHIFVKMINLFEDLPNAGYFTTEGYPMQVRQLMLGFNWTFFD
jgi:hypothetical protein